MGLLAALTTSFVVVLAFAPQRLATFSRRMGYYVGRGAVLGQQIKRIVGKALEDEKVVSATKGIREDLQKLDDVQSQLAGLGLLRSTRTYSQLLAPRVLSPVSVTPPIASSSPQDVSSSSVQQSPSHSTEQVAASSSTLLMPSDLSGSSIPVPLLPPELLVEIQSQDKSGPGGSDHFIGWMILRSASTGRS